MAQLLSHKDNPNDDLAAAVEAAASRIAAAGPEFGTQEQLRADLDVWQRCDLGRWMLVHNGWNAYWTRYCIGYDPAVPSDNEVEHFFLSQSPAVVATRQRSAIFAEVLGDLVGPGSVAMSVPCGLMDALVRLPDAASARVLIGLDLDAEALAGAGANATEAGLSNVCLAQGDAWASAAANVVAGDAAAYAAAIAGGVDVLTSNGLNIYVEDDAQVVELYRGFRQVLRPGGTAVVSAVTTPAEWDLADVPSGGSRRALGLTLINDVTWTNYRSVELTTSQLTAAGFEVTEVRFDDRRVFPTFVATAV